MRTFSNPPLVRTTSVRGSVVKLRPPFESSGAPGMPCLPTSARSGGAVFLSDLGFACNVRRCLVCPSVVACFCQCCAGILASSPIEVLHETSEGFERGILVAKVKGTGTNSQSHTQRISPKLLIIQPIRFRSVVGFGCWHSLP